MSEAFPCSNCGACCKSIRLSSLTISLDRGDGICRHFDESGNLCSIYETRPQVCNVQSMYEKHYKNDYAWPVFVEINKQSCEVLAKQFSAD